MRTVKQGWILMRGDAPTHGVGDVYEDSGYEETTIFDSHVYETKEEALKVNERVDESSRRFLESQGIDNWEAEPFEVVEVIITQELARTEDLQQTPEDKDCTLQLLLFEDDPKGQVLYRKNDTILTVQYDNDTLFEFDLRTGEFTSAHPGGWHIEKVIRMLTFIRPFLP